MNKRASPLHNSDRRRLTGVICDDRAETFEATEAAFAENWRKWIAYMGLREVDG